MQTITSHGDTSISPRALSATQQRAVILRVLSRRSAHTHELRAHGVSHPAARVMELRRAGYSITSTRITSVDSDGFSHHGVALYSIADDGAPSLYRGTAVVIGAGYGSAGSYAIAPVQER
ncbi:helix-turn-helix domain-containing protein [Burkholderia seminalis]|uniref:helix-turn-helix domain-containing protein n=1 Tax=Burkholderia seminalis TaxID=488731 RepID=UPI00084F0676|nr:helix-turn-helix domain-containing protein [Burkholderia seminalis]